LADRRAPIEEAINDTKTTIKTALTTSMPKIFNFYPTKVVASVAAACAMVKENRSAISVH
jgi:hypothetical protein